MSALQDGTFLIAKDPDVRRLNTQRSLLTGLPTVLVLTVLRADWLLVARITGGWGVPSH
jgi:hypothetical protein